jgi:UDP-glucose:(heptosyl)LPS alpha-1,3-glucosyltransferase
VNIAIVRKKYTFHGGAEGILHDFVTQLAAAGYEIHIFAIRWDGEGLPENVVFHKVPAVTFSSFLRDLTFAVFTFFMLKKQRKNFDIIQTHDKTLYQDICYVADGCHIEWLKQRWKRKGISGKLSILVNPYHWLVLYIEREMYRGHKFRKIFALSDLVKRDIMENYSVADRDIDIVYHWVDIDKFHPDNKASYRKQLREEYAVSDDTFTVLFVGSGFERKGLKFLIEAAESVPEPVTIFVLGKGSEKKFKGIIKNQKVIFCGPRKDVHKYYAAADIFVLPSMYEPFGLVYLESLASGIPVIATKSCGASEIIKDGTHGFLVSKPEDTEAMAGKIKYLINHRDELENMGKNARILAEAFTSEKRMGKIRELYEEVMDEKKY